MGAVSSTLGEDSHPIFLRNQSRFYISNLSVATASGRTILSISPNTYPADRYSPKREAGNDALIEYVQDPTVTNGPPAFLLQLPHADDLLFKFTFVIRQGKAFPADSTAGQRASTAISTTDTTVQGLTFLFGSTVQDLEALVTREFHADPNIHKNPQAELLGDYSTSGNPFVQATWSWRWKPPRQAEHSLQGWRTSVCFVEYNSHAHSLDPLAAFSFWVQNSTPTLTSPQALSPFPTSLGIPRHRVTSAQSTGSAIDSSPIAETNTNPQGERAVESGPMPAPLEHIKVDILHHRAGEDFSNVEDGPIFRAAMKSYELKTSNMKVRWKKALKRAEEAYEAHARSNEANQALIVSLKEISVSSSHSIRPAVEHYYNTIAKRIMAYEQRSAHNLLKMVIEPISQYYNFDIKQADSKKKDFEDESREYYAYVSRYLGARHEGQKEKKRAETDTKYQTKRRRFELKRFDYSSFVQDLHGGRKGQEVLSNLTRYAESQANDFLDTAKGIETMLPELKALIREVREADKEFNLQRSEREEKRRALETVSTYMRDMDISGGNRAGPDPADQSAIHPQPSTDNRKHMGFASRTFSSLSSHHGASSNSTAANPSNFEIPSQKDVGSGLCHKEGILWVASRTGAHIDSKGLNMNKTVMHPHWVVLDQGILAEYKKWQESLSSQPDQMIDIRVASARESHDSKSPESQFCFNVIAPSINRTYQTTSHEEMKNWVAAINRAAQSALADNNAEQSSDLSKAGKSGKDGFGSGFSVPVRRHATVGSRPSGVSSNSGALLKEIQTVNPSNRTCADCNSPNEITWAVINFGIVVCIKCSGVHRSLGTHISKVRSLTLDSNVFTVDVIELLRSTGNKLANTILEYRISEPSLKLVESASDEQRKKFIMAKYSSRDFVMPLPEYAASADEFLLIAVRECHIGKVSQALALRANANTTDQDGVPVFYVAVSVEDSRHAREFLMGGLTAPAPTPSVSNLSGKFNVPSISASPYTPGMVSPLASPGQGTMAAEPRIAPVPVVAATGLASPQAVTSPSRLAPSSRRGFAISELLLLNGADLPAEPCPLPVGVGAMEYLAGKRHREESGLARFAPAVVTSGKGASGEGSEMSKPQKRASVAGKLTRMGGR